MPPFYQHEAHGQSSNQNSSLQELGRSLGWVDSPNGRGTWDILQTCVVTLALCSWTSLVLNVPLGKGRFSDMANRLKWMCFTLFWPEIVCGCAFEQWESARQNVLEFAKLRGKSPIKWSIEHAFFADMGGFLLKAPDFPPFAVDGHQLQYLIKNNYITYPDVDMETIRDKNKADGFARVVTLMQVTWFTVQCVARALQGLTISTLELLTLNMIYCTLFTFFFWFHKPQGVQTQITLETECTIAKILLEGGDKAREPYDLTPLDFVAARPTRENLVASFWWVLHLHFKGVIWGISDVAKKRPVTTFSNSRTMPPQGYSIWTLIGRLLISSGYFSLHFAGWGFVFPTAIEQLLWRTAIIYFLSLWGFFLCVYGSFTFLGGFVARKLFHKETRTFIEFGGLWPSWLIIMAQIAVFGSYFLVRAYFIVEAFIGLRNMAPNAYYTVNWSLYVPHI